VCFQPLQGLTDRDPPPGLKQTRHPSFTRASIKRLHWLVNRFSATRIDLELDASVQTPIGLFDALVQTPIGLSELPVGFSE